MLCYSITGADFLAPLVTLSRPPPASAAPAEWLNGRTAHKEQEDGHKEEEKRLAETRRRKQYIVKWLSRFLVTISSISFPL